MSSAAAKRPRRQAKQARARETVDVILEAASRVLARHGYSEATTTRISKVAGVSVGTLYEYFANRDEVFDAVIRHELDALVEVFSSQDLDPAGTIDEKLGQLISAGMASMRHGPELFRSLEQVPGASFRRQLADARRVVIRFITRLLEEHRAELRVTDLELAAFVVVSAVEGVAASATTDRFDRALAHELRDLLRCYLTGSDAQLAHTVE